MTKFIIHSGWGFFAVKTAAMLRKEWGMETFALFCDMVAAFDSVDRSTMWGLLRKFGLLAKLIRLIRSLYDGMILELRIDRKKVDIKSTSGVKQGDCLSPTLFAIVIQSVIQSMTWPDGYTPLPYRTKFDGITRSRPKEWLDANLPGIVEAQVRKEVERIARSAG